MCKELPGAGHLCKGPEAGPCSHTSASNADGVAGVEGPRTQHRRAWGWGFWDSGGAGGAGLPAGHWGALDTEELYPDNHDGVITHLEPDILECEVKWALGSNTINKAGGGDGIPVELFQILKR